MWNTWHHLKKSRERKSRIKHWGTPTFRGQVEEEELAKDTENERPNKAGRNQGVYGSTEVKRQWFKSIMLNTARSSCEQKKEPAKQSHGCP